MSILGCGLAHIERRLGWTRATRMEVLQHFCFLILPLNLGDFKTSLRQKLIWGEKQNCFVVRRMKNSRGLGTRREIVRKQMALFPTIMGVEAPSFGKKIRQKKVYLCIVARVIRLVRQSSRAYTWYMLF